MTDTKARSPLPGLGLDERAKLPDALRVLLEAYPRTGWTEDTGFNEMIGFWLDRHLMFRRLLAALTADTRSRMDAETLSGPGKVSGTRAFQGRLSQQGGLLFNDLHMHHQVEDQHYFPVLQKHDPRLLQGFDILDRDHHQIDPALSRFAQAANGALAAPASTDALGALDGELQQLSAMLDRHLTDEEELVVPVLLKFGYPGYE